MKKADPNGDERVHIAAYDSTWPAQFEREKEILADLLEPWLAGPVEHIGSTAVPGLAAKPVIDIMAAVEDLPASRPAISVLPTIGYGYSPYNAEKEHWFCKPSPAIRTHHLHLVPFRSQTWVEVLAFRDHLRANPAVAAEYCDLKQSLARQYEFDRGAYTAAKGPFVQRILARAM